MEVVRQDEFDVQGREFLRVLLDGEEAVIGREQKLLRFGIVYVGGEWEDRVQAVVPADPDDGRPSPLTIRGATDDKELVAVVMNWIDELTERGRALGLPVLFEGDEDETS